MQHKQPKFSGILVVAVLMVLVLFFVSLSPLLAATGTKDTPTPKSITTLKTSR